MDDLDRLVAEHGFTEQDWYDMLRCEGCGHHRVLRPMRVGALIPETDDVTRACDHACCVVYCCAACGRPHSGFGVAGCPCDDGI